MNTTEQVLHIMYNGQSYDIDLRELDIGDMSSDIEIKNAVANYLEVPTSKLVNYRLDRTEEALTLRPQATFGK